MKYITKRLEHNLNILREKDVDEKDIIYYYTKVFPDTEILPCLEISGGKTADGKIVPDGISFKDEDVTVLFALDNSIDVEGEALSHRYAMECCFTLGGIKHNGAKTVSAVFLEKPYKHSQQSIDLFEKQVMIYADNIMSLEDFMKE